MLSIYYVTILHTWSKLHSFYTLLFNFYLMYSDAIIHSEMLQFKIVQWIGVSLGQGYFSL